VTTLSSIAGVTLALAVYAFLHYAVYTRVAGGLGLSAPGRRALVIVLVLAGLCVITTEAFRHASWTVPLRYGGSVWLGVLALSVSLLAIESILSAALPRFRRTTTVTALTVLALLVAYTCVNGSRQPVVKDISVRMEKLPAELSRFTLVQLTDLHLGTLTPVGRLRWIVDRVNHMSPDLVVITGDLIDRDISQDEEFCESLGEIRARYGVVAVPGNHDYYAGYDRFAHVASRSNIAILRNERRLIAGAIQVAGLDEPAGRSFAEGGPDLDSALAGYDPDLPTVLLRHRPEGVDRAVRRNVDLQLSGHTHAGQLPPMDLLIWLTHRHPFGYYEEGRSRIYVSSGTGTWGPPMRLFSRNEIVRFTLVGE
jgi:predicted MPP superfamily phosphohydrolase